ncbi:uncharacterized protein LOC143264267 isoform X2 [Megachile rotundata]|uniref:uncharacterized protein LOC143264267 isoform X2 n=1 Tax=Megachile rotundata TaxID=143995 RepID=UPI003FD13949
MAFFYTDQLKSDFQTAERFIPRTNDRESWCSWFLIKLFHNQNRKKYYSKDCPVKNISTNFIPKTPKITTIGLRMNCEDTEENDQRFWKIADIKNYLKQYFNMFQRYQSFLRTLWIPNCYQGNTFFSSSFTSMITKYSGKARNNSFVSNSADSILIHSEDEQQSCYNSSEIEFPFENLSDTTEYYLNQQNNETRSHSQEHLATIEISESRRFNYSPNDNRIKLKKNVSVQTSDRRKLCYRKTKKKIEKRCKENVFSKDIKIIFRTNYPDFNKSSKTNIKCLEIATQKQKHRRISTKNNSKIHQNISTNIKEHVCCLENTCKPADAKEMFKDVEIETKQNIGLKKQTLFKNNKENYENNNLLISYRQRYSRIKSKSLVVFRDKHESYESKTHSASKIYDTNSREFCNNSQSLFNEKHFGGGGEIIQSNVTSPEITNISWEPQNFIVEDKTSEMMILGNVKKRLEKDLDDYFSITDCNFDNDFFPNAEDSNEIFESGQSSPNTKQNQSVSHDSSKASFVLMATSLKHRKLKQFCQNVNDTVKRKQSFRTNLTCASSIHFSNLDISQSQSSYHTSFREQECSPSSSTEYCTASNISLSEMHNLQNSSFDSMFRSYTMDTRKLLADNCLSDDILNEERQTFQDTSELFDRTLMNSCAVCRYQRNSTPKLKSPSKQITRSLDSGIFADCSHDQLRIASDDLLRGRYSQENGQEEESETRELDLLSTYDFNTDSSYSDESLNRRVDIAVEKFTEKLILTERRARIKLKRLEDPARYRQERKRWKSRRQLSGRMRSFVGMHFLRLHHLSSLYSV